VPGRENRIFCDGCYECRTEVFLLQMQRVGVKTSVANATPQHPRCKRGRVGIGTGSNCNNEANQVKRHDGL